MNEAPSLDFALRGAALQAREAAIRPAGESDGVTPEYRAKVEAAAEKFEGFFISQMLRQMRQGTREMAGEDSVYNNRINQDMLDMADTRLADSLASQRAFGIADAILRQLLPPAAAAPLKAVPLKDTAAPVASSD
jgi:flagellar protein FlgJ